MKKLVVSVAASATLIVAVSRMHVCDSAPQEQPVVDDAPRGETPANLPVAFVPNVGQWEHEASFVACVGAMSVFLAEDGWTFTLADRTESKAGMHAQGVAVRMTFEGAATSRLAPESRLPGVHHYYLGNDPRKWRRDVPVYAAVRYHEVRPGTDVLVREADGHFEYDLILEPGASLDDLEIRVEGGSELYLDSGGVLVLDTALGPVRMPMPSSWEEEPGGERIPIPCRYVLRGEDRFGFEAPERHPDLTLVVDPGLVWSTYLGGGLQDDASALSADAAGAVTVAGRTHSDDFPTTLGAYDTTFNGGETDVFITRIAPDGSSLVYSTFLGGRHDFYGDGGGDSVYALALNGEGGVTAVGWTTSDDFPTTPGAYDTVSTGGFVIRLSPDGGDLVYSTFLKQAEGSAVAVDAEGSATVVGRTASAEFPTTPGAYDRTYGGKRDAFVTRFSPDGSSLLYSTYLGGTDDDDRAYSVALDGEGSAIVVGRTSSADFPTTPGAYDTTYGGRRDAFVSRLSPDGSHLQYSTFLGGSDSDDAHAVALAGDGAAIVVGDTSSGNFPTTPLAYDTSQNGESDVFVARLSPDGSHLVYSTFLGGAEGDYPRDLTVNSDGAVCVAGRTRSADFPTTPGSHDPVYDEGDIFVSLLWPDGSNLGYSSFLGGTGVSPGEISVDPGGNVTVVGSTFPNRDDFHATPGAYDTTYNGGRRDAFVARFHIDIDPSVFPYGTGLPGSLGVIPTISTGGEYAVVGSSTFKIRLTFALGGMPCVVAGSFARAEDDLYGLTLHGDFLNAGAFHTWWLMTSGQPDSPSVGTAELMAPIPNHLVLEGFTTYWQAFVSDSESPLPIGVSHTGGLKVRIVR